MSKRVREVNRANVAASSRRLSGETAVVVDKRRRVKEADDLEWIMAELKAHPERREAVRAQLEASVEPKYDSRVQFNSENAKKTIIKVPPKERAVSCALRIPVEKDSSKGSNGASKILDASCYDSQNRARSARSCMLSGFWMQQRLDMFSFSHTAIKYDEHFVIDRANSGHYSFQYAEARGVPTERASVHAHCLQGEICDIGRRCRHQGFVARGEQLGSHGGLRVQPRGTVAQGNVLQVFHRCALGGVGACCGVVR